ncbi:MAG: potassium-transporting ATPase subunit KdpC [Isosphaeraceae bacterium]
MKETFRSSVLILVMLTLLTGVVYPCVVTLIAQAAFPHRANGSIVEVRGKAVGSELIGQSFSRPEYFWGRLSATAPIAYNAAASGGSNFGPLHPDLVKNAKARIDALRRYDPLVSAVPVDLATSSGSGLDPHISPAAAELQIRRVAIARMKPESEIRDLVKLHTEPRQFGVLGEPRVNTLLLNLALDEMSP